MIFIELCLEAAAILKGLALKAAKKKRKGKRTNNPSQTLKKVSRAAAVFFFPRLVCLTHNLVNCYKIVLDYFGVEEDEGGGTTVFRK